MNNLYNLNSDKNSELVIYQLNYMNEFVLTRLIESTKSKQTAKNIFEN